MDDKIININNFKDYITDLNLDIKDKISLINFISSLKSEILNNIEKEINVEIDSKKELVSIFSNKKDYKNLHNILTELLYTEKTLEFFNNQKNK